MSQLNSATDLVRFLHDSINELLEMTTINLKAGNISHINNETITCHFTVPPKPVPKAVTVHPLKHTVL